ncbi:ABC transporter permease [Halobacillus shinanisalinarum]|uniref:ABC transporter permease n=1 Tax=Halobacillus shinanisalinarum TaxID=2932258 RepID=A0ABY4GXV3_9BACI|nr:ABC transporter permease [Halobacillus shinanisalinarum]UOQ92733.1 ABC transporter permease [Halobacillus shinanisalinarum]
MYKFFIMVGHTFTNRVKTKSFLITTLVTLALIIAVTNIQTIIDTFSGEDKTDRVAVITDNEEWFQTLEETAAINDSFEVETYDKSLDEAKEAVEKGTYQSVVEITTGESNLPEATYYANEIASAENSDQIKQALQQIKVGIATEEAGVDQVTLQQISSPVAFETVSLEESAKSEEELAQTRGLVYVMLFLLYMSVIMYGSMIATEVATEKSSRVMEILISSVSPVSQMFAKIIGIALVGMLQFCLILIVGYFGVTQNGGEGSLMAGFGLTNIQGSIIAYAVLFFILGYLLYATLAATLGSLVSRLEDAQQMIAPMIYLILAAFFISVFGLNAPESTFVTVSSYFPFFSPLIMFLRVGMLDIPVWEVILSVGVLVASIAILAWFGARIYSGGVLLYGKSSSFKDIKKAMQLSKKEK